MITSLLLYILGGLLMAVVVNIDAYLKELTLTTKRIFVILWPIITIYAFIATYFEEHNDG